MIETIHIVTCDGCGKELMRKYGEMPTQSEVKLACGIWFDGGIFCNECFQRSEYSHQSLDKMDKELANTLLNEVGKEKWCRVHNKTANVYRVKDGKITEIDPQGWWY